MKRIYTLGLVLASTTWFACNSSNKSTTTDSTTVKKDSTTVSAAPADSSSSASSASSAVISDTTFASKAAVAGMAEVALGKMAASKATTKEIKDFGNMMVMDHGKANEELMAIAKKKNITLPTSLDAEHQAKSDSLSKLSGAAFDKGYVNVMVEGHKKVLALMQGEASNGKDADLKAFASKTAPVVQHHLDVITKIQSSLK